MTQYYPFRVLMDIIFDLILINFPFADGCILDDGIKSCLMRTRTQEALRLLKMQTQKSTV